MNPDLHFAWWLTVPGSDEPFVQAFAIGATPLKKAEGFANGRPFRPYVNNQPNRSMPPVIWWGNGRKDYTLRLTFEDGTVVNLETLSMKNEWFVKQEGTPPAEHRRNTLYQGQNFMSPLAAVTPWGNAEFDLWVKGCKFEGGGTDKVDNWFPGWRRVYITDCLFKNCMSGPQGGNIELVRSTYLHQIGGDAFSDARVVWCASVSDHVKGRADLHPDTYQFRSRGPKGEPKLLAGIKDQSRGSQGIFADRSTFVRNTAIVQCRIGTDGVGAALSLENGVENLLIDSCEFTGPRFITPSRKNVVIRKTPGVV